MPTTAAKIGRQSGVSIRTIRLATGMVLFTYVTFHLIDHALGNLSINAMETMLRGMKAVWQSVPGAIVLYTAMAVHLLLAFWALYERRHYQWPAKEFCQTLLGFCIPVLLANHILATRVSLSLFATDKGYNLELYSFWVGNIPFGIVQHIVLVVAWAHGCLGIYFWLRLKPWFSKLSQLLLSLAVLLPALALLGSFQAGRQIQHLAQIPAWRAEYLTAAHTGTAAQQAGLAQARALSWAAFLLAVAATLAARLVRTLRERRRGIVRLSYSHGRTVSVPLGHSVLEASRLHRIPHTGVCGGRGRCTTCRILILRHAGNLPPPSNAEAAALARIAAGAEIRLACQLRPAGDLHFSPLVPTTPPTSRLSRARALLSHANPGEERYLVLMFVDLRGSTELAEHRLPYDTLFIINSFLNAVGHAVVEAGGAPNTMLGDGMLALFGLYTDPATAARQAMAAIPRINENVANLNRHLSHDLAQPLRFSVGLHGGEVIVGNMGFEAQNVFTALGDPVNVAARLQALTKDLGCDVLVSDEIYLLAGEDPTASPAQPIQARGRGAAIMVRALSIAQPVEV